ncbi:hypothetical protein SCHPADRAFT_120106 [Schizopora paradoxa]|uniref:Methyltransferase domain-containing protein n=1 Tax=Schizopora paradoxa TaxID=27342 RepID=A0A0H2S3F2_9AGAM|nr:hypothetical protein SCHPADRAFT_120106 [Schizopora paradoxa]
MSNEGRLEFSIPSTQQELDDFPFTLNEDEWAFFRKVIGAGDEELKARFEDVRRLAFSHYPYPCIRRYHFINLMMMQNPIYPVVLEEGRKGDAWFLDIGCCMGTDVRKLVLDGYPAANVAGCDLRSTFMDMGKNELFGDAGSCEITFFIADIFDLSPTPVTSIAEKADSLSRGNSLRDALRNSNPVDGDGLSFTQLRGRLTHVYVGAVFHLFDEPTQYSVALRVAALVKNAPGSVIFGRHQGKEEAGDLDDGVIGASTFRYGHSASTWKQMWVKVYEEIAGAEYAREHIHVRADFVDNQRGLTDKWLVWSVSHL